MILITGATGHLGRKTLDFLQTKVSSHVLTAMVRDKIKAKEKGLNVELRVGDYNDYASLVSAFKGIEILLLISSGTLENRLEQHIHAVDAAKENGVQHIVYTSVVDAKPDTKFTPGIDHYHTEEYIRKSGIPYTLFRNTFYTEIVPMLLGDALSTGTWYYAAGDGKINFASRTEMAEALANVLATPKAHQNKVYEITSRKSHSFYDIADMVSEYTGRKITYVPVTLDALEEGIRKAGVPESYIPLMVSIADSIASGELDFVAEDLEILLGRKPEDLRQLLPKILSQKKDH
jgi:NAD(P)H dehydrogenase (quinone)